MQRLPMFSQANSRRRFRGSLLVQAVAVAGVTLALLAPANAQFWRLFGGSPPAQQQRPQQQPQQGFNPFGGFFGGSPPVRETPPPPADYSRAPASQRKIDPAAVTTPVVVVGDAMADWLAYGLEDAFSETPEIAIVRKHRTYSGLIRYDTRRDVEWPQVAKEIVAAEKPKFIVMMVGLHDRQAIRERVPAAATPSRQNAAASKRTPTSTRSSAPLDPELQARQSADQQNAELQELQEQQEAASERSTEQPAIALPEQGRGAIVDAAGPFEFRSEKWEAAYIRRIDATIVALKSAGIPAFWVGLPPQRGPRTAADTAYLNDLYRQRAEKAGIIYVDVWDGFVDTAGQYTAQGPDFEGQTRRLRSADGVYFTKPGARKLAHYVEREIQRAIANRGLSVALPTPEPAAPAGRPGGSAQRPLVGPAIPLTASTGGPSELLGGAAARPIAADPVATRVLTKGEPVPAPSGRADDFSWPRNNAAIADPPPPVNASVSPERATAPVPNQSSGSKSGAPKQSVEKRPRNNPPAADGAPRPPAPVRPSASATQGTVR
jgi:hypothetical protein